MIQPAASFIFNLQLSLQSNRLLQIILLCIIVELIPEWDWNIMQTTGFQMTASAIL